MKKYLTGLVLLGLVLGMASASSAAGWGVGGFAGVSIPIAQDDAENGTVYGARVKLSLGGLFGIEPNISFFKDGEWDIEGVDETFEGSKFTSIGINLLLNGAGPVQTLRFVPFVGAKYYNEDNEYLDRDSRLGWTAGMGVEVGAGNIGFEGRAALELMTLDGGASRKWAHVTGGVNLYFGAL